MADTTVKFFHSAMTGAPTLSGAAGALIGVLDACLVNGFGSVTLDSLVVASNVATGTKAGGHSLEVGSVVLIAGATPGGLNGEWKVATVTATTFTFVTSGIGDQTASGTITAKLAGAGWAKTHSTTNKAAYKSNNVAATGCLIRVDDTGTINARVVGYETMSDIDTGTGPFPTAVQQSGGNYWPKSAVASGAARNWIIVADDRFVHVFLGYRSNSVPAAYAGLCFGDFQSTKSGDAYNCVINGDISDVTGSTVGNNSYTYVTATSVAAGMFIPRSYTALGSSITAMRLFPQLATITGNIVSGSTGGTAYPNPPDGGLYAVPHYLFETINSVLRGVTPGFYCVPQTVPNGSFVAKDTVTGVTGLTGKSLKVVTCSETAGTLGMVLLDITGPWIR